MFFKVQEAWMKRNQNISKNYMSERIFEKHKIQTDNLIEKGWINILKDIRLIKSTIISVKDFNNDNKDSFSALIKAEMIDYHINEKSKQVVDGIPYRAQKFEEIWNFIQVCTKTSSICVNINYKLDIYNRENHLPNWTSIQEFLLSEIISTCPRHQASHLRRRLVLYLEIPG